MLDYKMIGLVIGLIAVIRPLTVQAEFPWVPQQKPFVYQGGSLACEVNPTGEIKTLRVGSVVLLGNVFLHGRYDAGTEKHDSRFFQTHDETIATIQVRSDGDNRCSVKREGILTNAKYPDGGARYIQTIQFSPNSVKLTYQVDQTVELMSYAHIFTTLHELPLASYADHGAKFTMVDDTTRMLVLPVRYEESNKLKQIIGIKVMRYSLDVGVLEISADDDTSLSIMDTRSWGGSDYRVDIQQKIPWSEKLKTFPAGQKYQWSYTITFTPSNP